MVICSDSQLVVNQVIGEYEARDLSMIAYLAKVKEALLNFRSHIIRQIPRSENTEVDALSRLASTSHNNMRTVYIEDLPRPSILGGTEEVAPVLEAEPSWIDPLASFLIDGTLPAERNAAKRVQRQAAKYVIIDEWLYRRSYMLPYLRCL